MRATRTKKDAGKAAPSADYALTAKEEAYVTEYMVDFDPIAAARRMGYARLNARPIVKQMQSSPAVQREIQRRINESKPDEMYSEQQVIAMLLKEASHPYSSGQSRLAAIKLLDEKKSGRAGGGGKNKAPGLQGGKMLLLPVTMPVDDWEQLALQQQTDLKAIVRE